MLTWRIIYPRGNRRFLDVVQVRDYESEDWDIASSINYDTKEEAWERARELAEIFALRYVGDNAFLE